MSLCSAKDADEKSVVGGQESVETYVLCMACLYAVDHIPNRRMIYDARHTILEERSLHFASHSIGSLSYIRITCFRDAMPTYSVDCNPCHPTKGLNTDTGILL
jgi:hypothetical protein